MKKISIIMPFLNEADEPYKTIQSIYDTSDPSLFEIIAIDDNSNQRYDFSRFKDVKYIRNTERLGVDGNRQIGAEIATTDRLLIIDAHERFIPDSNWLNKMIDCIDKEPETAWCCTSIALGYGINDITPSTPRYYGADLMLLNSEFDKGRPSRECIEPKWRKFENKVEYEVPCILGANYFLYRPYFMHIRGLKGLKMWGSSEPLLSLKYYLSGGTSKIRTDIETAHIYRQNAPYTTMVAPLYANKVYICKTLFPDNLANKIIASLPQDNNFKLAMKMLEKEKESIEEDKKYFQSIFKYSIYDYCQKFNIVIPN